MERITNITTNYDTLYKEYSNTKTTIPTYIQQARSQGGLVGVDEPPSQIKRLIISNTRKGPLF